MRLLREEAGPDHAEGAPSLRENALAVRSLTDDIAARAQAYLFLAAGIVGALGVILPHPPSFNAAGMLSVQIASIVSGALILARRGRMPRWCVVIGPFGAAALTSLVIGFSGSSTSPYLLFYLWVAFYAFYFLSRPGAATLALFTLLNYVAVVCFYRLTGGSQPTSAGNGDISAVTLVIGTVAVAGVFIVKLRERVGRLIRQLTDAATTDALTSLLNRRGFHDALLSELARAERAERTFTVLVGDCDFFKQLNDSLGHQAGDEALVAIGQMLRSGKRGADVAARVGGEEFALLLPETPLEEAYGMAERLRTRLSQIFARQPIPLTMSFGVAAYPAHGATCDSLLHAADEALYAAKALGRDRSVVYSDEIDDVLALARDARRGREDAHLATVLNLAEALDTRDAGTARHSQTVGRYSELMAAELGLDSEAVERVRVAGVLHDIGKIGVPDAILSKPGKLTDEEFDQMRKHPEIGARILGGSGLDDIKRWVLAHHERPDGRGYPYRLSADEIPFESKILAVADAYEAMTADRVYRKALGPAAARRELRACAGSQFDPDVVAAFLRVLDRGRGDLLAERVTARAVA